MEANMQFSIGEIIVFTSGEYSDYGINGFGVSLESFDINEQANLYAASRNEYEECDYYEFIGWLVSQGLIAPVKYREFDLGCYGQWSDDFKIAGATQ